MTFRVLFKTGTTAQNLTYTGLVGEITINTDTSSIRVHNCETPGGIETARKDLQNVLNSDFYTKGILSGLGQTQGQDGILDGGDPFIDQIPPIREIIPIFDFGGVF
jgi:hypothetical protein